MKRFLVFVSAAAMLVAVSCAKEEVQNIVEKPVVNEEPTVEKVKWVISASAPQTKTTVDDQGTYKWVNGDAIKVFDAEGDSLGKFTVSNLGEPASTADFVRDIDEGKTPKYAVYPYNANATCTPDGVISTVIPTEQDGTIASAISCATSTDGKNFTFTNAVSVIKLNFNAEDNICGVTVEFEEPVSGAVEFDCNDGSVKFAASKVVKVEKNEALSGEVYLCVAPTEKTGITLTFTKLNDEKAIKNATVKNGFEAGFIKSLGTVRNLPFQPVELTLKEFAKKFVKVLDLWEANENTVNKKGGHMIPVGTTISFNGVPYDKAAMYEVAVRGFVTLVNGGALNDAVPSVHNYAWGSVAQNGDNATYNNDEFVSKSVTLNFLWNCSNRQISYAESNSKWANYVSYPSTSGTPTVSGYKNCCLERHLLMMARFYKYLLDNNITSNIKTACANISIDAGLYEANYEPATLKDFAVEFSKILEKWENNVVDTKRKVPADATVEVGGISYNRANMYEVAVRGLASFVNGGTLYDSVPTVHNYAWGTSATATYSNDDFKNTDVSLNFLRNYASRQISYAEKNSQWANLCGYDGNPTTSGTPQVSGYYNGCGLERHLLMMARFYKYLIDESINYNIIDRVGSYRFESTLY